MAEDTRLAIRVRGALVAVQRPMVRAGQSVLGKFATPTLWPIGPAKREDDVRAETSRWVGRALLLTFLGFVVAPTLVGAVYFAFVESDQFVTETRLAVRSASDAREPLGEAGSGLLKGLAAPKSSAQDSYIILNYARSLPVIGDIGGATYLQKVFGRDDIDYLSRLDASQPLETLSKYWTRHVTASLEGLSGIVTIRVYAYSPQDSLEIANRIVDRGEKLINNISARSRNDAVALATGEVEEARSKLAAARAAIADFRNRNVTIDPVRKAEDIGKLISDLTLQKIQLQTLLSSFGDGIVNASPSARINRSRLDEIDKQISDLKQQLTTTDSGVRAVSGELADYERLKLAEQFAEKMYQVSQLSLERASRETRRQQLYLSTIVRPTLPERALYPERLTNIILTFAGFSVIWGILSLLAATIIDHLGN